MNKISIIIPCFNKWNFTQNCLNNLSFLPKETHEIIVIDNGSTDITRIAINDPKYDFVRYIRNDTNLGFSKSCNIAYSLSTGNIIIFLNNDIRVNKNYNNWTDVVLTEINKNKNVLVGPTGGMIDINNNFQFMYETNDINKPINYMSGWCLAAHKDIFDSLKINEYNGPFSEEFGTAYYEDTDLGFRASLLGIQFKLVDIPVSHFGKITSTQLNVPKLYNDARKIFIKKWSKHK